MQLQNTHPHNPVSKETIKENIFVILAGLIV